MDPLLIQLQPPFQALADTILDPNTVLSREERLLIAEKRHHENPSLDKESLVNAFVSHLLIGHLTLDERLLVRERREMEDLARVTEEFTIQRSRLDAMMDDFRGKTLAISPPVVFKSSPPVVSNILEYLRHRESGSSKLNVRCSCARRSTSPVRKVMDWVSSFSPSRKPPRDSALDLDEDLYPKESSLESFGRLRIPATFEESPFDTSEMDKIFCSAILSDNQVILGTKCERLKILNVQTSAQTLIEPFVRNQNTLESLEALQDFDSLDGSRRPSSGIHSISINPSQTLVAIGCGKPLDYIHIYALPLFKPVAILEGHADLVFSIVWVNDDTLISGSRDCTMQTWVLKPTYVLRTERTLCNQVIQVYKAALSQHEFRGKVRDLTYDPTRHESVSLSIDGHARIWDINNGSLKSRVKLAHAFETVCMGLQPSQYVAIGSQSHISILDSRTESIVHVFDSCDDGWGVRSLVCNDPVVTIGGGMGRISFYDMRAQKYLESIHWSQSGWIHEDEVFHNNYQGITVRNAVYTLNYRRNGSSLFSAGGPLQLSLKGSHAALWN